VERKPTRRTAGELKKAAERKAEAAAAIPFPLKPLFLAAAADAMICQRFLIK